MLGTWVLEGLTTLDPLLNPLAAVLNHLHKSARSDPKGVDGGLVGSPRQVSKIG